MRNLRHRIQLTITCWDALSRQETCQEGEAYVGRAHATTRLVAYMLNEMLLHDTHLPVKTWWKQTCDAYCWGVFWACLVSLNSIWTSWHVWVFQTHKIVSPAVKAKTSKAVMLTFIYPFQKLKSWFLNIFMQLFGYINAINGWKKFCYKI